MDGSVIISSLDLQHFLSIITTTIKEINSANLNIDTAKVKTWLDRKKTYEMGSEQAKKNTL